MLPIWGLDVVLGMQWLRTLGPCVHDHNELTMEFQWEGRMVKLAGNTKVNAHQVTFSQLITLIIEGAFSGVYKLSTKREFQEGESTEIDNLEAKLPAKGKGIIRQF